ncbi:MAG: hypothetical protein Q7S09_01855, partial [bacterium]|nr:hypothetical protein [bacterium]
GVGNFYVKRISSIDYTDLPDTTTQTLGNDLAVITTAATVAKNTAFGDGTVPPSLAGAKLASFVVQGGVAEDARISSVKLDFVGADDATSVSNLVLKVNDVQQGIAVGAPTMTGNTYSVNINVPKSTPVIVDVFGDVKADAVKETTTAQLRIPAAGLTMIGLSTSNSITPPTNAEALQTVTFGAGTLKITKDSSSPVEQILTPANGVLMGTWKFEAKNEDLSLKKVTFTVLRGDGLPASNAPTGNFGQLSLKDGSTTLATGSLVNQSVVFSGFNLTIPASGSKNLSLYSDLTSSGTQSPGSIAMWTIATDTTPTDIDVTGSAGQLTKANIDGGTNSAGASGAESTFATSTRFLYHNSKPVVAAASNTPSGSKTPQSTDTLFIFTITNSGTRDMRISSLSVTVSVSGNMTNGASVVSDIDLYDGTQKIGDNGKNFSGADTFTFLGGASGTKEFVFNTSNDTTNNSFDNFVISAGASKTFTLKADTSNVRAGLTTSLATVSTKVNGTTGFSTGTTWNEGDVEYYYTPVFATEQGPFSSSDSYPVNGGTLTY